MLEDSVTDPAELTALLETLDAPQRDLLDRLLDGSPVGRTRDAAPGTPPDRPVQRLLAAGLLRQVDHETVILPRQVGQLLRGEAPAPAEFTAPQPVVAAKPVTKKAVDAAGAGAIIDLLRELEVVIETLGATRYRSCAAAGSGSAR